MNRFPLDEAERAFTDLLARSEQLIDGTEHPGLPDRPVTMPELVAVLRDQLTTQETCDSLWSFLLEHFDDEPWATLSLGLALPPMRKSVAKAARIWDRDIIDLQAEAVNAFLEMARHIDPASCRLYSRICNHVKDACRTFARGLARNARTVHLAGMTARPPAEPWSHIDLVLKRAVRNHVISGFEAEIITNTRLEGEQLGSLARKRRLSRTILSMQRRNAEHRLIEWLTFGDG